MTATNQVGSESCRSAADGDAAQATTGELDLALSKPTTFDIVGLQEPISRGQRVSSFAVDAWDGTAGWTQVTTGSTIGYKRLIRLDAPVTAQRVRLRIIDARATMMISTFALYRDS